MQQKKLGNTDIMVSKICLGTMNWGAQNNEQEAHEQLDYGVAHGINFIDTLSISQEFTKVKDVYMPTAINFQFNGNVLGFKFSFVYLL